LKTPSQSCVKYDILWHLHYNLPFQPSKERLQLLEYFYDKITRTSVNGYLSRPVLSEASQVNLSHPTKKLNAQPKFKQQQSLIHMPQVNIKET